MDGDGFSTCEDCDDGDPGVNPDAEEVACDGIDNDCADGDECDEGDDDDSASDDDDDDDDDTSGGRSGGCDPSGQGAISGWLWLLLGVGVLVRRRN